MSVPVLESIADAIYRYEGDYPGTRAYRNRNPGNLRPILATDAQDDGGYRVFPSLTIGYNALLHDLASKVVGLDRHGLNMDSSLLDLIKVWAPASDRNDPERYAEFVAAWLRRVYVLPAITTSTTFRELYQIARQEAPGGVAAA